MGKYKVNLELQADIELEIDADSYGEALDIALNNVKIAMKSRKHIESYSHSQLHIQVANGKEIKD